MQNSARNAFTLVELLVVTAIMAILGVYVIANYTSFGEDQNLKNAALDIQGLLRNAQANATSNTKCAGTFFATWQVEVLNSTTFNLKCSASVTPQKTLQLTANNEIKVVSGDDASCPAIPFSISFAPISGSIDLGGVSCTSLTFTIKNTKTGTLKDLTINKGGRVYGQ